MSISLSTPSFQFLYGECSPDPRTTKPPSLSCSSSHAGRVCLVFPLQFPGFATSDLISKGMWLVMWEKSLSKTLLDVERLLRD
jgi:hypothetical protein